MQKNGRYESTGWSKKVSHYQIIELFRQIKVSMILPVDIKCSMRDILQTVHDQKSGDIFLLLGQIRNDVSAPSCISLSYQAMNFH